MMAWLRAEMKPFICLILFAAARSCFASCLSYTSAVVDGKLVKETFPGRPNYESIAGGDVAQTGLYLLPVHSFCVAHGQADFATSQFLFEPPQLQFEPYVAHARALQLEFDNPLAAHVEDMLWQHLGQRVICRGSLEHQQTARDHAQILMEVVTCDLAANFKP